jgi:AAHS family benzoate transporter-like MFS transporter
MATVHMLVGVFLGVPAGAAARRWGGHRVLSFAMCIYGAAFMLLGRGSGEFNLWAVMLLAGVGFGLFHPIGFGMVAQLARRQRNVSCQTATVMGRFAAIGDIGRVCLGWAFVALVAAVGLIWSAFAAGGVALGLGLWLLLFGRMDSVRDAEPMAIPNAEMTPSDSAPQRTSLLRNRGFGLATGIGAFDSLSSTGLIMFTPLVLTAKGYQGVWMSVFVALLYGGSLFGKVFAGWVADRVGAKKTLVLCQGLLCVVTGSLIFTHGMVLDGFLVLSLGLLTKSCLPIALALTATSLSKTELELGFGWNQMLTGLAAAASPLLMGVFSGTFNASIAGLILASVSCAGIAAIVLIGRR